MMNKEIKKIVYDDYGFKNWLQYSKRCFLYKETRIGCSWRKAQYYTKSKNVFLRLYWKAKWLIIRKRSGYQISLNADIGPGFKLLHDGTRIVVSGTKIGKDCMIGINVIVGLAYSNTQKCFLSPTIGDRVYIGHNSSIVGGVKIGNDVLIAPNTFVNQDIPDHSVVIGNDIIKSKNDPSLPYITKLMPPD